MQRRQGVYTGTHTNRGNVRTPYIHTTPQEILDKMTDCGNRLDAKKAELEVLLSRRQGVVTEFDIMVPDNDSFREQLTKIFMRCVQI